MSDREHHNRSQLQATFTDYEDNTSPYEGRALRLSLSSDVLFVYVGRLTEGAEGKVGTDRFEYDDDLSIGIDAELLYETLGSMLRRDDRETAERARAGTLPADHPSRVTQLVPAAVDGLRRRRA